MPLRLIRRDDREDIVLGGTTFTIRKVAHGENLDLARRATTRGVVDAEELEWLLWESFLVGWKGLYDENGVEVAYAREMVRDVAKGLPQAVAEILVSKAREPSLLLHEASGNSSTSSGSAAATT